MAERWVKLYEKIEDSSIYYDSELVHLWVHLLIKAQKYEKTFPWNDGEITLTPGQILSGRKRLSSETGIPENKIQRGLKRFERCHMIEQQTTNKYRLITIVNWNAYQTGEQQTNSKRTASEQQVNNERTASEHIQERKKDRKEKERNTPPVVPLEDIKPTKTKKRMTDPPDIGTWVPSENLKAWSKAKGVSPVDLEKRAEVCFDWFRSKGRQLADWEAGLRNWISKDIVKTEPIKEPPGWGLF